MRKADEYSHDEVEITIITPRMERRNHIVWSFALCILATAIGTIIANLFFF